MLNFYDFIQVYVFTTNHHLKFQILGSLGTLSLFFNSTALRKAKIAYNFGLSERKGSHAENYCHVHLFILNSSYGCLKWLQRICENY